MTDDKNMITEHVAMAYHALKASPLFLPCAKAGIYKISVGESRAKSDRWQVDLGSFDTLQS